MESLGRQTARRDDRDKLSTWQTRQAQHDAVCDCGIPDHDQLQRLSAIDTPVLVANVDSDPMILPHFSYLLALIRHHAEFARDVDALLRE